LSDGFYGFARDRGVVDIAGVSITNDDSAGIGFDNARFLVPGAAGGSGVSLRAADASPASLP